MTELADPFEAFDRATGAQAVDSPYPELAALRRSGAVHPRDVRAVFGLDADTPLPEGLPPAFQVVGHEAVAEVLRDAKSFSSGLLAAITGPVMGHTILEMDAPEHHRYRALLQQAFSRKAVERWETELIGPLVHRYLDGVRTADHADLVRQLTFPFPVAVIAGLMGLPPDDLPRFHRWAVQLISYTFDRERALEASAELRDYFAVIVATRREQPGDDLVSLLAGAELEGTRLSDDDIFAFLRLLLPAGAETTYRSTSNLLLGLLTHPDQLDAVCLDRSLIPAAVEEGLRWEPPLTGIVRQSTGDATLGGVPVPAGALLSISLGSANHDEQRWPGADEFDITRPPRGHLAFGAGPHTCLGMHLARMESAVLLGAVLDRLPGLRLDPGAAPVRIRGSSFRAPARLPVVFDRVA